MQIPELAVTNVSCKRNDTWLFAPVSFTLRSGQMIQVQGPNGIGKSTLLRALTGLSPIGTGAVHWQNKPIREDDQYRQQLTFIGHKTGIKGPLSVLENLLWSLTWICKPSENQLKETLGKFGLLSHKNQLATCLSSGQKQRLALAKLWLANTKLWILDEPLTALDQEGIELIQAVMTQQIKNNGMIIFTSHQTLGYAFPNCEIVALSSYQHQHQLERCG